MSITATFECPWALLSYDTTIDLVERTDDEGNVLDEQLYRVHSNCVRKRNLEGITAFSPAVGTYSNNVTWESGGQTIYANTLQTYLCTGDSISTTSASLSENGQAWEYIANYTTITMSDLTAANVSDTGNASANCLGNWILDDFDATLDIDELFDPENDTYTKTQFRQHNILTRHRDFITITNFSSAAGDILDGTDLTWDNGNDIELSPPAGSYYLCTGDSIRMAGDNEGGQHSQQWEHYTEYATFEG